jgi:predicted helicase
MQELMPGALGPNGKPQSGLATMHDGFALSFSEEEVEEKVKLFSRTSNREQAKEVFGTLCNPQQWDYAAAKRTLSSKTWRQEISRIWFCPFDIRYTVYDKAVAVHLRRRLSDHLFKRKNLALVIGEAGQEISGSEWDAVCCVDGLLQLNYFRRNGSPTLPLYLYGEDLISTGSSTGRRINLSSTQLKRLAERMGLEMTKNGLPEGLAAEDIFYYAYAIFFSPAYRNRYAEFLKSEFPRLPLTGKLGLFHELARLGGELVALHLLKSSTLENEVIELIGNRRPEVEKVSWSNTTVWLDKAQTAGFRGVARAVWNFHIGGYQVCEKWLKDRKDRKLLKADIDHYSKIVSALAQTIDLMKKIDAVIERQGGWPGAFEMKHVVEATESISAGGLHRSRNIGGRI